MSFLHKIKEAIKTPKYNAAFLAINLLLGTGPIIIPEPFFEAGIVLSGFWMIVLFSMSLNSAFYIGESIQRIEQHVSEQQNRESLISQNGEEETLAKTGTKTAENIKTFTHIEQFKILYGEKWKYFPAFAISIYLLGVSISKCIMTGKTLSKLFGNFDVVNRFEFWLGIFFLSGAVFSFKDITKTKPLQIAIISVRIVSILLMIIGALIIIGQNGHIQTFQPEGGNAFANFQYFGDIFSNLVFSFLFHHSLPTIAKTLKKGSQIRQFLKIAFAVAGTVMLIIPITGIMAFGNNLVHPINGLLESSHKLIYYNEDFRGRIDIVYYIVSFYVFLNVAAFSVYIIVIRENMLGIFFPKIEPNKVSKSTLLFSIGLLAVILFISFILKDQIQTVLSFTSGIFGGLILFIMPCMEVYKARKLSAPEKSFLNSYQWTPLLLMGIGFAFMGFNLFEVISHLK